MYFFLLVLGGGGGGKINRSGQLLSPGEDNQGGGKISWDIFNPGGQAVQGDKINCWCHPVLLM